MNNDALVGYTGFVGGNLVRQHQFQHLYNSKNIDTIRGRSFDLLVLSAAQAKKWWANLHPEEDWAGIQRLLAPLSEVTAKQVVLISTIDVLPNRPDADEDLDPHDFETHAYGTHRLRLEDEVKRLFDVVTIVRLPGLFGPGLKKNVIYDLLNGNQLEKINPASSFQYYDLTALWGDIQRSLGAGIELVHLFTEPVPTAEIIARFFPAAEVGAEAGDVGSYDYPTKHAALFGGQGRYIWSKDEVLRRMGDYIHRVQQGGEA